MSFIKSLKEFLYRYAILILLLMILSAGGVLIYLGRGETKSVVSKPLYHFYFILQNSVDPFWDEVIRGAKDSARDNNAAVEFCAPRFNDPNSELKYMDIATISKVDGIITHVPSSIDFTQAIDRAYYNNIPVITFENDDGESKRFAFVGTNSFTIGQEAARLLIEATGGKANIAVISSSDLSQGSIEHNLKMNGFISTLKNNPEMKILKSYTSKMGILSAEEITQTIIDSGDNIDAIFTVNSSDTLGAAQFIVDRNRVGAVTLVGFGSSDEILRYIEKGIIFGTVASDPYKMGYESIKALVNIKSGKSVPTIIDTEVNVITKKNMMEIKADKKEDK